MSESTQKRRKNGIMRRWVAVSLLTTMLVLAVGSVAIVFSMRQNYYDCARQALENRIRLMLASMPVSSTPATQREEALRDAVEGFSEKDKYECMLVNDSGRVIATSSGFAFHPDEPLDDFYLAASAENGVGYYIGYSRSGEHIIAVTQMLEHPVNGIEAIRYVSSLSKIDESLYSIIRVDLAVCAVVLLFTLMTGFYFIRSIVYPLAEVGRTASRIADGDFDVRIANVYNDEIGDLCETINDMAEGLSVSDRVKNEFISNVSHELRTPLTSIKGWGETLQSVGESNPEVFHKGMEIIISETERLSVLVEDLLDFSRVQSGDSMKMEPRPLDLGTELRDTLGIFEQRAKNLGITLQLDPLPAGMDIMGDKNRLRQVFANIVDNAIKYSLEGGIIRVWAERDKNEIAVHVQDNGVGIPAFELPAITERFYKAQNSVTGSGIGLAVVKEIVTLHGGTLEFESELKKGTCVTVRLPS